MTSTTLSSCLKCFYMIAGTGATTVTTAATVTNTCSNNFCYNSYCYSYSYKAQRGAAWTLR